MDLSYDQTVECVRASAHTIDSLIEDLTRLRDELPGDTVVVLSKDAEGNGFSPLIRAGGAVASMYLPRTTWSGQHYLTEEDRQSLSDADAWEPAPPEAIPAVVLWPTN